MSAAIAAPPEWASARQIHLAYGVHRHRLQTVSLLGIVRTRATGEECRIGVGGTGRGKPIVLYHSGDVMAWMERQPEIERKRFAAQAERYRQSQRGSLTAAQ